MAFPAVTVEFSPTTGPFDTPTWISLSAGGPHGNRVLSADWTDGKQSDLEHFPPGQATLVLRNDDRLFDPEHAAGTYYGDLNPRVPFRIRAVHAAVTYDLFYGFVEEGWEQTYQPPKTSTCTVQLVDMLTILSGYTLPGVLESIIKLYLQPVGYWPLTEEEDAPAVTDLMGAHDGTAWDEPEFNAAPLGIGLGPSTLFDGVNDRINITRSPLIANPAVSTVMAVFATTTPAEVLAVHPIFAQVSGNPQVSTTLQLHVASSGKLHVVGTVHGAGVSYLTASAVTDGDPHIAFGQIGGGAGDYGIGIDTATLTTTTTTALHARGNGSAIGGPPFASKGNDINHFSGRIGHVAVWDRALASWERDLIMLYGWGSLDGYRTDQQIEWALLATGVPSGMFDLDEGRSIMGPADTSGKDLLTFIRELTATEQGGFYVDHANGGKLRFRQRYASFQDTRSTTTQATFSDDPAASWSSVARVEPGTLQVEANGVSTVINQVNVSWRGGKETIDESAGSLYGPRPLSIETQAGSPLIARGLAQWILAHNSTPKAKIKALGITPGAEQTAFPVALATRIGDRVAYRSHPQNTGSATTKALEVLGRHHTVDDGRNWSTEFYLTAAPNIGITLFTLGTSQLGGTHILAY